MRNQFFKFFIEGSKVVANSFNFFSLELGLEGEHQKENASLAVQLCRVWFQQKNSCEIFFFFYLKNCENKYLLL